MTLKGFFAGVRPAEWPLLGFALYVLIRAAAASHLSFKGVTPPGYLIVPFVAVFTVRLALAYRRAPWREEFEHRRVLHTIMLVPFLGVGLVCFLSFRTPVGGQGGTFAPILLRIVEFVFSSLVAFVTPVFAWLLYGMHIKKYGSFRASFFREAGEMLASDLRDWAPPLLLIYSYGLMRPFVSVPFVPDRDDQLWRMDCALFLGHNPHELIERIITPWLSEWLAAVYVFYTFIYPIVLGAVYTKSDPRAFRELSFATTFALATGYIVYTFVPAQGPVYTQNYTVNIDFYHLAFVKEQLMDRTRIPRDCFPSLHTCMSLVMLFYAWKNIRWLGYALAPIALSIPFACVYLRYHYVVDVVAGTALFALTVRLQKWIFARETAASRPSEDCAV